MKSLEHTAAIEKLRIMRHRLETALDRFYGHDLTGDPIAIQAAALDIATPIRVMVHHSPDRKPPSICLLDQVDQDYWRKAIHFKPLINQAPKALPPGVEAVSVTIPVHVTMSTGGRTTFTRYNKGADPNSMARLTDWWHETCWDSGTNKVSNKDIVLGMANKEGGTHVDGDMPARYAAAKNQGKIAIGKTRVPDVARLGSMVGIAGGELLEYLDEHFPESA